MSRQGSWKVQEASLPFGNRCYSPLTSLHFWSWTVSAPDKQVNLAEHRSWGSALAPRTPGQRLARDPGLCQHPAAKGQSKGIPKDV